MYIDLIYHRWFPKKSTYMISQDIDSRDMISCNLPRLGPAENTIAHWLSVWSLRLLLQDERSWAHLSNALPCLLAAVLLEQKIILLGPADVTTALAFAIYGLVWPFQWFFIFSPVLPVNFVAMSSFPEAPSPFIVGLAELPEAWGSVVRSDGIVCVSLAGARQCSANVPKLPGHDKLCCRLDEFIMQLHTCQQSDSALLDSVAHKIYQACNDEVAELASYLKASATGLARELTNTNVLINVVKEAHKLEAFFGEFMLTEMAHDYLHVLFDAQWETACNVADASTDESICVCTCKSFYRTVFPCLR